MPSGFNDATYLANRDVLAGVRFIATMSLNTPLRALQRHGEVFRGPPSRAPVYGDMAQGTWSPVVDWRSTGLTPPSPSTMASVIGQIPTDGGDLLPFLIEFRLIVESGNPIDVQLQQIDDLVKSRGAYRSIVRKLGGKNFARKWFASKLTAVPGVGPKTAWNLFAAGYRTLEELGQASEAGLRAVPGIGPGAARKIRAFFGDTP